MPRTPKRSIKPKIEKDNVSDDSYIIFMGCSSDPFDEEEDSVTFNFNVCPDSLDMADGDPEDYLAEVQSNIESLLELKGFISAVSKQDKDKVEIESDFYYGEGDMLIRVQIEKTHSTFAKLFTKPKK